MWGWVNSIVPTHSFPLHAQGSPPLWLTETMVAHPVGTTHVLVQMFPFFQWLWFPQRQSLHHNFIHNTSIEVTWSNTSFLNVAFQYVNQTMQSNQVSHVCDLFLFYLVWLLYTLAFGAKSAIIVLKFRVKEREEGRDSQSTVSFSRRMQQPTLGWPKPRARSSIQVSLMVSRGPNTWAKFLLLLSGA